MKVAFVGTYGEGGGAARAMVRVAEACARYGADVGIVTAQAVGSYCIPGDALRSKISALSWKVKRSIGASVGRRRLKAIGVENGLGSVSIFGTSIFKSKLIFDADVVSLHWPCDEFLSIKQITRLSPPVVWTFHDMWPMLGSEHYRSECDISHSALDVDATYRSKLSAWRDFSYDIVGPSEWMTSLARKHSIGQVRHVAHIPNCIDVDSWTPIDKEHAKLALGVGRSGRKVILFGAVGGLSDTRKGGDLMISALKQIGLKADQVDLVIFGGQRKLAESAFLGGYNAYYLGGLVDDLALRLAYSAADVFVVPSRQENFANTILESMSCGTPVVGFDIGGNSDCIRTGCNGVLVEPYDTELLASAMVSVLEQSSELGLGARAWIESNYSYQRIGARYCDFFDKARRT